MRTPEGWRFKELRLALAKEAKLESTLGGLSDTDVATMLARLGYDSLDDLMTAYAESLPVFGDSRTVSRLAVDMVEVSKLRTVIDLWAVAEEA